MAEAAERTLAESPIARSDAAVTVPFLLRFLLVLFAWTTVLFWLPTVRSLFDGASYEWGVFSFRGAGLTGDYWFVALASACALAVQWLGWRGNRLPAEWLLLGWFGLIAAGSVYLAITAPESFRFRGDTLGLDFSLAWIAPLLFGAVIALALTLLVTERQRPPAPLPRWTRRNAIWLGALVGLLPMQLLLLRFGAPDGLTDQAGVVLTIVQWLLVGRALRPV